MINTNRLASPWRYGLGMLAMTIPGQMYLAYYTFYYTEKLNLGIELISVGLLFFTVFDAFNDPFMGWLSDRTRTKWGRRKPWLIGNAPFFALFVVLVFAVPKGIAAAGGTLLLVYFTVMLILTETSGTINTTNYHALFPELFKTAKERGSANSFRQSLQVVGMIIGVSLTPLFVQSLGYVPLAIIYGIAGMALLVFAITGCREDPSFVESERPQYLRSLLAVAKNRNFWLVAISNSCFQAVTGITLAAIPFFVKYVLQLPGGNAAYVSAAVFVTAIPSMFVWSKLLGKTGVVRGWQTAMLCLAASFLPFCFVPNLALTIVFAALVGFGFAGVISTVDIVIAKIIDQDAERFGLRREATLQSCIGFITRASGLLRSVVFALIFMLFGFSNAENPGENPATACRFMIGAFPLAIMLLGAIVSRFVSFKEEAK